MMKVCFRAELKFNVCPRNSIRVFIFDFFVGLIVFCLNWVWFYFNKSIYSIQLFASNQKSDRIQWIHIFFTLASTDESTLMVKKSLQVDQFFDQCEFERKWNSIIQLFAHWNRGTSELWCWEYPIHFGILFQIRHKIDFFYQNFSTNQNSRKIKFNYFTFSPLESKDEWTLMLKNFYWLLFDHPIWWEIDLF